MSARDAWTKAQLRVTNAILHFMLLPEERQSEAAEEIVAANAELLEATCGLIEDATGARP